jgi:beta-galactosidase
MTFFSGIVDKNDRVFPGAYPAPFREMLGLWIEEVVPYPETQTNTIETQDGQRFNCSLWSDVIHLEGAQALAAYTQDYFSGSPAVTVNHFGNGSACYLGTQPGPDGLSWLLQRLCAAAGIQPALITPAGVECIRRTNGAHTWLFLLNHTGAEAQVDLPVAGVDLITGKNVNGSLSLAPKGVAIIRLNL